MKTSNRIKTIFLNIRSSIQRFPITISLSTILAISLIYLGESNLVGDSKETLAKVNLILGLSIPLSLCIGFLIERFFKKDKKISVLLYALGIGYLILYYLVFLDTINNVTMSRYIGNMLFLLLAFLYIPRIKKKDKYEYYIMDLCSGFVITFIYSFVLYFGIAAILITINQLFDIDIRGQIYYYMFLIVFFIFAISLFLSKLPSIDERYDRNIYTKSLNILLLYIVIPLITIYTGILYVYFAKILITREWPRGLVSHLVLWYSTIAVGVIFLITPIIKENRIAHIFKLWFPKINIPILFMMFTSIYKRVNQYGITENRYYLIALGLWVLGIMTYFSIKKDQRNIIIPISLSLIVLNSIYGPFSSFALSKSSQNKRFENILVKNNMLMEGEVRKNLDVPLEDRREISNIISYFDANHKLEDMKALPKDFQIDDMENLMGFKYTPYYRLSYEGDRHFYYGTNLMENVINISGYDYYLAVNSWDENKREAGELTIEYNKFKQGLIISRDDIVLFEQDINELVEDIYRKQEVEGIGDNRNLINSEDMSYHLVVGDDKDIELMLMFTNISGKINEEDKVVTESVEFILLINN